MTEHHVEMFTGDPFAEVWGWQCFTCGEEQDGYGNFQTAEHEADRHVNETSDD